MLAYQFGKSIETCNSALIVAFSAYYKLLFLYGVTGRQFVYCCTPTALSTTSSTRRAWRTLEKRSAVTVCCSTVDERASSATPRPRPSPVISGHSATPNTSVWCLWDTVNLPSLMAATTLAAMVPSLSCSGSWAALGGSRFFLICSLNSLLLQWLLASVLA